MIEVLRKIYLHTNLSNQSLTNCVDLETKSFHMHLNSLNFITKNSTDFGCDKLTITDYGHVLNRLVIR